MATQTIAVPGRPKLWRRCSDYLHSDRGFCFIGFVLLLPAVLAYMGMAGAGFWHEDEYIVIAGMRQPGWRFILGRLAWSPRPFSEAVFYFYTSAVNHFQAPLVASFITLLWIFLLAAILLAAWDRHSRFGALGGLALLSSLLTGGRIEEVFYWPAGAVAYIPTLAAMMVLFFLIAHNRLVASRGRVLATCCLLVAAFSSEVGAMLAVWIAVIELGHWCLGHSRKRTMIQPALNSLWWLIPGICGLSVLTVVAMGRGQAVELANGVASSAFRHPLASLAAAMRETVREDLGPIAVFAGGGAFHIRFLRPVFIVLLICGVGLGWRTYPSLRESDRGRLLRLAVAMLLTAFTTAFSSYLHFGILCCERHETMRRALTLLALSALAIVSFGRQAISAQSRSRGLRQGCLLLLAATLPAAVCWSPQIVSVYRQQPRIGAARQFTFRSGYAPGDGSMKFQLAPADPVLGDPPLPAGVYSAAAHPRIYPRSILQFFHKQRLVVLPSRP